MAASIQYELAMTQTDRQTMHHNPQHYCFTIQNASFLIWGFIPKLLSVLVSESSWKIKPGAGLFTCLFGSSGVESLDFGRCGVGVEEFFWMGFCSCCRTGDRAQCKNESFA